MSQTHKIKDHLVRWNTITPMEALSEFGCFRLAARIAELKKEGMSIRTLMAGEKGKRFARYIYEKV